MKVTSASRGEDSSGVDHVEAVRCVSVLASHEHEDASLVLSSRGGGCEIAYSNEVVAGEREVEDPVHSGKAAVACLAHHPDRLQPAEDLLDPLPLLLADFVARMAHRTEVERAIADLVSHVGSHLTIPQPFDEIG